jgi:hypothetical protein
MLPKDPYTEALHRLGDFAGALGASTDDETRADLLVDRFFWQGLDHDAAQYAVDALDPASATTRYLAGRHAYSRLLFEHEVRPDDQAVARAGFEAAAADPRLAGWGEFYLSVFAYNILEDAAAAKEHIDRAAKAGDPLVQSYVVRHLSVHEPERAVEHLRHSLYLRATLGYRPHTAAAMAALADSLPDGPERTQLREAALLTAHELGLSWLTRALS